MGDRPKRRKDKYNPYTLEYCERSNTYMVTFNDGENRKQYVQITKEIYEAMNKFELEDLSAMNEYDNHIEHAEVYENTLVNRAVNIPISLEEIIEKKIMNGELKKAINNLSEIQKRRIKLYYFEDLTQSEIAKKEGTSIRAVQYTLNSAIQEIKKFLKMTS